MLVKLGQVFQVVISSSDRNALQTYTGVYTVCKGNVLSSVNETNDAFSWTNPESQQAGDRPCN